MRAGPNSDIHARIDQKLCLGADDCLCCSLCQLCKITNCEVLLAQLDKVDACHGRCCDGCQQPSPPLGLVRRELAAVRDVVKEQVSSFRVLDRQGNSEPRFAFWYGMSLSTELAWLLLLALPVGAVSWTVTHEEIFREPRAFFERKSESARSLVARKLFYIFTCEYCFSHYVAALFVAITGFVMLYPSTDWRGYLISWLSLVWVANIYMNIFARLRLDIKRERVEIKGVEADVQAKRDQVKGPRVVRKE
jgi:hypothetical protein